MRRIGRGFLFASGVRALLCGGNVNNGMSAGVFASNLNNAPSNAKRVEVFGHAAEGVRPRQTCITI